MTLPLIKKESTVHYFPNQMKENTLCECNVIKKILKEIMLECSNSHIEITNSDINNPYEQSI